MGIRGIDASKLQPDALQPLATAALASAAEAHVHIANNDAAGAAVCLAPIESALDSPGVKALFSADDVIMLEGTRQKLRNMRDD